MSVFREAFSKYIVDHTLFDDMILSGEDLKNKRNK